MVVSGYYSVRLVQAVTKEPFKEHVGPDGKFYAEVEPGEEYFIEIEILPNKSGLHTKKGIDVEVDGKHLGYCDVIDDHNGKQYYGLWSSINGEYREESLKFCKVLKSRSTTAGVGNRSIESMDNLRGSVCVYILAAYESDDDFSMDDFIDTEEDVSTGFDESNSLFSTNNEEEAKKSLCSCVGSHVEVYSVKKQKVKEYIFGRTLKKITIYYRTAAGLVKAGILPNLTSNTGITSDYVRSKKSNGRNRSSSPLQLTSSSVSKRRKMESDSGKNDTKVIETTQPKVRGYTLIDLTDEEESTGKKVCKIRVGKEHCLSL